MVDELPGSSRNIQYKLLSFLGQGSWGMVYRAKIITPGYKSRVVALKVLRNVECVRALHDSFSNNS
jgi:hypothetical protein